MQTTANTQDCRTDADGAKAFRLPLLHTASPVLNGPIVALLLLVLILISPGGSGIGA